MNGVTRQLANMNSTVANTIRIQDTYELDKNGQNVTKNGGSLNLCDNASSHTDDSPDAQIHTMLLYAPIACLSFSRTGQIEYMNQQAQTLLGENRLHRSFKSILHSNAITRIERWLVSLQNTLTEEQELITPVTLSFEAHIHPNNTQSWGKFHLQCLPAEPQNISLAIVDISEQIKAVEKYRSIERQTLQLINTSPSPAILIEETSIKQANQAFLDAIGYKAEDIFQLSLDKLFDGPAEELLQKLKNAATGSVQIRLRGRKKDIVTLRIRTSPISLFGCESILVQCEQITNEHSIQSHLDDLDTLLASVIHEINNPLSFVSTNLEAITKHIEISPDTELKQKLLQMIEDANIGCSRATQIIRNIKTMYQGEMEAQCLDPNDIIRQSIRLEQNIKDKNIKITHQLQATHGVEANLCQLIQIITNLIVNAKEAMPANRAIPENHIHVATWSTPTNVHITVKDNASGIDNKSIKELFKPFYSSKKDRGGSGLGLFISQQFIRAMGGDIFVHSQIGQGSTFELVLPSSHNTPKQITLPNPAHARSQKNSSATTQKLRILLVDDEQLIIRGLKRHLTLKADIVDCPSGQTAWNKIQSGENFDVIISDYIMPDGNGLELFERIKKNKPELSNRFLLMTGLNELNAEQRKVQCIRKPFPFEELWDIILKICG